MSLLEQKKLSIDFSNKDIKVIKCSQYDDSSRNYRVSFFNDGVFRKINALNETVKVKMMKPDGNPVFNKCEINSDGTANLIFTEQMCAVPGIAPLQFMLLDISNQQIANTMPIKAIIETSVLPNDAITSSYEFDALASELAKIDTITNITIALDCTIADIDSLF